MKNKIITLLALSLVAGCSSSPKNERVVYVEKTPTTPYVQPTTYVSPHVNQVRTHSNASPEQAKTVCETAAMRQNAIDYDNSNDIVRIMTVQDSTDSSRLVSEVEVDCRDYFLRKSLSPSLTSSDSNQVHASTTVIEYPSETRSLTRTQNQRHTYIVQRGDTVWGIAREHCTSAKAISRLNGLGSGNTIDIGQRIKLPDEDC